MQAHVKVLETQLHESGLKFTKELGGILEIHEAQIEEMSQAHRKELAELRTEERTAEEKHTQLLEDLKEEYSEFPSSANNFVEYLTQTDGHACAADKVAMP